MTHSSSQRFSDLRFACAFALAVLCASVIAGWLLRSTAMVEVLPNADPMPLAAAFGLLLAALRHMLPHRPRAMRRTGRALSWAVCAIGAAALLQIVLNRNLGLDFPGLHVWINDAGANPGRVPVMIAAGLFLAGAIGLLDRPRLPAGRTHLVITLIALLMTCGMAAVVLNWLDLGRIYDWNAYVNTGLPAGGALIVCAVLCFLQRHRFDRARALDVREGEKRIVLVGGLVAGAAAVIVGLVGIASQQTAIEHMLERGLESSLASRTVLFASALDVAAQQASHYARMERTVELVRSLVHAQAGAAIDPGAAAAMSGAGSASAALLAGLQRFIDGGDVSASLLDNAGHVLLGAGDRVAQPAMRAALPTSVPAELLWGNGLILRSRVPVLDEDRRLATLEIDRKVDELGQEFFSIQAFSRTGEVSLCMIDADARVCFPNTTHATPRRTPLAALLPYGSAMMRAMNGERGVSEFEDANGHGVIAAYRPFGPMLGAEARMRTSELFAPARRALGIALPVIVLLVFCGIALLRLQLAPLVARLAKALRLAHEQKTRIELLSRSVAESARSIERADAQLHFHATHDPLTGLANRATLEKRLDRLLAVRLSTDMPGHALVFVDLDQFKIVNDACGHHAGDELLRKLAQQLKAAARASDVLARIGGDEFALLLENCGSQPATRVAEGLRRSVAGLQFEWEGRSFRLTSSIGVVCFDKARTTRIELMRAADAACLLAKERGRNRVEFHEVDSAEIQQRAGETHWFARLQEAIEHDSFVLYRQRIAPAALPQTAASRYEVLVRLRDEDGRIVSPGAFIPAAERYGLMPAIDRAIVRKALAAMAEGARAGDEAGYSINLSGASINDASMTGFLVAELHASGVDPRRVCFEVTETEAIANLDSAAKMMQALRELGCSIALDDFGAGMSSFAYLRQLPVDYLKIDGRFVKGMLEDSVDLAMVEAMHGIAERLGLKTVAEFVENEQIFARVRELGVHYAQGYAIAAPEPMLEHAVRAQAEEAMAEHRMPATA